MKEVSNLKSSIVYAQALYGGAEGAGELQRVYEEARVLQGIVVKNHADYAVLDNPLWQIEAKQQIIEEIAKKLDLSQSLYNLLRVLLESRKFSLLADILQQFIKIYQNKHDIAEIDVTTVLPLSDSQNSLLKQKLAQIFRKDILINYHIDSKIIGGLVIKYGTNFIDNSIQNKLNMLKQLMKGVK